MPKWEKLSEFTEWCEKHIAGDEKGQAQIFLDRLYQGFGQSACLEVGGATEFHIRKGSRGGGGTAFADYVWKPVVLVEMKKTSPTSRPSRDTLTKIDAVAAAASELRRVRAEALPKLKGGLRALYRTLELPGANQSKDTHAALDTGVLTAYGFSPKKDLLAQLLALNQQVTAPGAPENYPDAKKLVTEDCIRPAP